MDVFDIWNRVKKKTSTSKRTVYVKERDVVFVRLGKNIGHEQDGRGDYFLRPVVVLKKFNNRLFWAVPLTTQEKQSEYYILITNINNRQNWAIWSQLRLLDTARVGKKIGVLNTSDFKIIKKAITESLG